MKPRFDPTRLMQICFIVLLLVCAGQVSWWFIDQVLYTRSVRAELDMMLGQDIVAAKTMLDQGCEKKKVEHLFKGVLSVTEEGAVIVNPSLEASLEEEARRRLRRYGWEGGFFLIVLGACVAVLWHALRSDAILHRRQHNFLAAVSHEFKSPLASARLAAETLALRQPEPERQAKLVARVLENLGRLERMVVNLLDTARIEEGELDLEPQRVVLERAARTAAAHLELRIVDEGGNLEIDVPGEIEVFADPRAVDTVLQNLIDNARKAIARAGGTSVRVRGSREGDYGVLVVEDDGDGFEAGSGTRLFEKFYRPGDEMRRSGQGSGLGLYIVSKLVAQSGGHVSAHSEGSGRGARFEVRFPLAEES